MSTPDFREKVKQLEKELQNATAALGSDSCISMNMIVAGIVPIVVFLGLYVTSPSFVTEEPEDASSGSKPERSLKKVIMWTTAVTLVAWACIYGYSAYKGSSGTLLCARQ